MDDFAWSLIAQQKAWLDRRKAADSGGSGNPGGPDAPDSATSSPDIPDLAAQAVSALLALAAATDDPRAALTKHLASRYEASLDAGAPPLPSATFNPDRAAWIASLPRILAGVAVILTAPDDDSRILLVRQSYRPGPRNWSLPGGGTHDNEPPYIAAQRECLEELSLTLDVGRLLAVDWLPTTDRPPITVFVYEGGRLTPDQVARIRLLDGELTDYGFFTLEQAASMMSERNHPMLAAAIEARDTGRTIDLRRL